MAVIEQAKAKINLTLHVLGRKSDGFHELNSVVAFADIADELEVSFADENSLFIEGPFAGQLTNGPDNIIWKAWSHLAAITPVPQVKVRLAKNLPIASGIGGGSADAAALVRGVLRLIHAGLTNEKIKDLSKIGADVPVCFSSTACNMRGIGEELSNLGGLKILPAILLVNPLLPCSTAQVFAQMGLAPGQTLAPSPDFWRNDMTGAALKVQPIIADVLAALHQTDLQHINMSGSGATCFGLAHSRGEAEQAARIIELKHPNWWVRAGALT